MNAKRIRTMNKAEQRALLAVYQRPSHDARPIAKSYRAFRRTASYSRLMGCWLVYWRGMTLGIEPDGYTHS